MKLGGISVIALLIACLAGPAYPAEGERVIYFVGDSITAGFGVEKEQRRYESYPAQVRDRYCVDLCGAATIRRVGRGGQGIVADVSWTFDPLLETFDKEVLQATPRPTEVVIESGLNDLAHAADWEIRQAYRTLRAMAREAGVERVYIGTITPSSENLPWPREWIEPQRQRINDWIRAKWPYRHIDFAAALEGPSGKMRARYDSGDGLHPNALGASRMAWAASERLRVR